MLYFFLSYARGADDPYVEKFYHDLCTEVRVVVGADRDVEVGFFDNHSIEPGQRWSSALVTALSQCRTFLALYSPAYFLSVPCGKEWSIFARRTQNHELPGGTNASPFIPLVWMPQRVMPEAAQAFQYASDLLGDAYNTGGLRRLLRLQRNRDEYLEFVSAVALRIVESAETPPLSSLNGVDFDQIPSAFHAILDPSPGIDVLQPVDVSSALPGTQVVHFVVAAAAQVEASTVRTDVRFYGGRPQDWSPYLPALRRPLVEYARKVASDKSFQSNIATIEQLHDCMAQAHQYNQIVVLLVDMWSARLERYRTALSRYDRRNEPTTAVMIPHNQSDAETQAHGSDLAEEIRQIFLNNTLRHDDVMFRSSVLTHDAFGADLQVVLEVARNRVFVRGTVFRRPPWSADERPILEGP